MTCPGCGAHFPHAHFAGCRTGAAELEEAHRVRRQQEAAANEHALRRMAARLHLTPQELIGQMEAVTRRY